MLPICTAPVKTPFGEKEIRVYASDILNFDEPVDILTTSAYVGSYHPTPGTLFEALGRVGVDMQQLAAYPQIDLRHFGNVWLSREVNSPWLRARRMGCVEMNLNARDPYELAQREQAMLHSIKAYFQMLELASIYGIPMDTVALPLLGAGRQRISAALTMIPILNECIDFLQRNESVKRIFFIERDPEKAELIASAVRSSYQITQANAVPDRTPAEKPRARVFLSYSSPDKNIADNLCAKLEREGIQVWYAPRDVRGPYAAAITEAIGKATHFVVILSENSMRSEHVLNEIDLAFQSLPDRIKFKPLRMLFSLRITTKCVALPMASVMAAA